MAPRHIFAPGKILGRIMSLELQCVHVFPPQFILRPPVCPIFCQLPLRASTVQSKKVTYITLIQRFLTDCRF